MHSFNIHQNHDNMYVPCRDVVAVAGRQGARCHSVGDKEGEWYCIHQYYTTTSSICIIITIVIIIVTDHYSNNNNHHRHY
jgi:hypothetical protein